MPEIVGNKQLNTAYTQLIPLSELAAGQVGIIRNEVIRAIVAQASFEAKVPTNRLVVRDILPATDLDYGAEEWGETTGGTVNVYETMTTGTMATDRWMAIFGVKLVEGAGSASALKFNVGGGDRFIWQIQSLSKEDDYVGYCSSPVIITQNSPYTISRYVRAINNAFSCILRGVVVETRGKLISP